MNAGHETSIRVETTEVFHCCSEENCSYYKESMLKILMTFHKLQNKEAEPFVW